MSSGGGVVRARAARPAHSCVSEGGAAGAVVGGGSRVVVTWLLLVFSCFGTDCSPRPVYHTHA